MININLYLNKLKQKLMLVEYLLFQVQEILYITLLVQDRVLITQLLAEL
uniref:Uncharacterized protein n=1 Tax=Gloeothece verrucosa (strain PCC 7822) TaxID=497965 RepID=E0UAK8_GLOV7|nr:hypothetical protein Cyan7822_0718 [Gloeothece verrucosa PCC 7822]